jgi:hypothetical protein
VRRVGGDAVGVKLLEDVEREDVTFGKGDEAEVGEGDVARRRLEQEGVLHGQRFEVESGIVCAVVNMVKRHRRATCAPVQVMTIGRRERETS